MVGFLEKLENAMLENQTLLCVGLDPVPERMHGYSIYEFNRAIIDATQDLVCAYKPNLAFYEAQGLDGLRDLEKTLAYIPDGIPVIGDGKRGDVGSTAEAYAKALFEVWGFDAITVNPYGGRDAIEPFTAYSDTLAGRRLDPRHVLPARPTSPHLFLWRGDAETIAIEFKEHRPDRGSSRPRRQLPPSINQPSSLLRLSL